MARVAIGSMVRRRVIGSSSNVLQLLLHALHCTCGTSNVIDQRAGLAILAYVGAPIPDAARRL